MSVKKNIEDLIMTVGVIAGMRKQDFARLGLPTVAYEELCNELRMMELEVIYDPSCDCEGCAAYRAGNEKIPFIEFRGIRIQEMPELPPSRSVYMDSKGNVLGILIVTSVDEVIQSVPEGATVH